MTSKLHASLCIVFCISHPIPALQGDIQGEAQKYAQGYTQGYLGRQRRRNPRRYSKSHLGI